MTLLDQILEFGRERAETLGLKLNDIGRSGREWYLAEDVHKTLGQGSLHDGLFESGNMILALNYKTKSREERLEALVKDLLKINTNPKDKSYIDEDLLKRAKALLEGK